MRESLRTIANTDDMQVVLKFSGSTKRDTTEQILTYLVKQKTEVELLLIEGPTRDGEFDIPDDSRIWDECRRLITDTYEEHCRERTCHFFFDCPAALAFGVGKYVPVRPAYSCYTLNDNSKDDRYTLVLSKQQK